MTRTITVYNRRGPHDVEADVRGPFAIHPSIAIKGLDADAHPDRTRDSLCRLSARVSAGAAGAHRGRRRLALEEAIRHRETASRIA